MPDFGPVFERFLGDLLSWERWPLWGTTLVFATLGIIFSERIFTRDRAYVWRHGKAVGRRLFWYWMRETLPLHPFFAGAALGFVWTNPEGPEWSRTASMVYFAIAGALSLPLWLWARAKLKAQKLALPGDSMRPRERA